MCSLAKLFQSNGSLCENVIHTMVSGKDAYTGAHRSYTPLVDGNLYRETIVEGVDRHGNPIYMQSTPNLLTPSEAYQRAICDCYVRVGKGSYRPRVVNDIEDELYDYGPDIGRRLSGHIAINIVVLKSYTLTEPALVKNVFQDIVYKHRSHRPVLF